MPLVRITVGPEISADKRALGAAVHKALVDVAKAPADDQFQIIEEAKAGSLIVTPSYLGVAHTRKVVFVQIFLNAGRASEVKAALYAAIGAGVAAAAGVRAEDVIINLVEVAREDWSFGGGVMSYPPQK
jgi:phenylpyruvate tautomerase PptA (4-oxalocrotonate tautomerase family)